MTTKEYFEKKRGFLMMQDCTLLLPKEQSIMLSYLIDTENWDDIKRLKEDESFFWANKEGFISNYLLGWSVKEITAAIDRLKAAGYIDTKIVQVDLRKRTYIKINMNAIIRLDNLYELIQEKRKSIGDPAIQKLLLERVRRCCSETSKLDELEQKIHQVIINIKVEEIN